jgi:hypothetical protein
MTRHARLTRLTVGDFSALLTFLASGLEASDAAGVAERINVSSHIRSRETASPLDRWQAVLSAALRANAEGRFLEEVSRLVGTADKEEYGRLVTAAAKSHLHDVIRTANPEFGSIASRLVAARSLGSLNIAAQACRTTVAEILASVEVGSSQRAALLIADNSIDVQHIADRIATLALNVLMAVDRLLDLTDVPGGGMEFALIAPSTPDDLRGATEGEADDPQTLALARNARNAAYQHLQRLFAELTSASIA